MSSPPRSYLYGLAVISLCSGLLFLGISWTKNPYPEPTGFPVKFLKEESDDALPDSNYTIVVRRPLKKRIVPPADPYHLDPEIISRQYSISPKSCASLSLQPYLVLVAFARPDGFKLRTAIRRTWGSLADPHCGVRLLFMFGRVHDENVQKKLLEEAKKFGDIIQSNQFDDKYRSAAVKAIHLLQWAATFCPESVYTAKIDDDNWLNLPQYLKFLRANYRPDAVYGGLFSAGTSVIRDPSSKYYVPWEEYDGEYYPEYLSGILYAFPTKQVPKVVYTAKQLKQTFNDDVFVCGMVATKAGLKRREVPAYAWDHNIHDSICPKRDKMCIHYSKIEDFYRLWNDPCYKYEKLC